MLVTFQHTAKDSFNKRFCLGLDTLDTLIYVRQLKEKNIAIFFEKENVNTLDSKGEFLITLLGSLAQEESSNIFTPSNYQ